MANELGASPELGETELRQLIELEGASMRVAFDRVGEDVAEAEPHALKVPHRLAGVLTESLFQLPVLLDFLHLDAAIILTLIVIMKLSSSLLNSRFYCIKLYLGLFDQHALLDSRELLLH